ncbi:MAG: cyclic nucleotide-binding domain-containing protein [Planctomycetes bacterium]|nr:cyclic nucleotide-binding domain-containing protein [Planctomycetota bacterium]
MTTEEPLDKLLATPLFADVGDELLDAVRTEAAITAGTHEWPATAARRAGFVRFQTLADGEEIVRQGDLTTELLVVLDGTLASVQSRGGREVHQHKTFGPGTWFGEVSAHSHHPALATWRARGPASVAAIEARLFTRLYAEDETFRGRIDTGYRDNLGLHLRASSLCRDLDDTAVQQLQQQAELVTLDEGSVLVQAGAPADTFWLVRAGAIACTVAVDGSERTLAFYKGNATFGEHAIAADGSTWPATFKALMRTALVAIPKSAWQRLAEPARGDLRSAANRLIGRADVDAVASGSAGPLGQALDELHVMVERESVKGGRALVIDRGKCVRCNMCVESCVSVHDDHVPRLSKMGTTVATDEVLVTACYHCELPQCMLSCEYAAIRRDPQGRVRFEYDNCVGCASCIDGCPYGVIRLVEPAPPPPPIQPLLASLPIVGKWFRREAPATPSPSTAPTASCGAGGKVNQVSGKTVKCDLCAGLPFEACVYNCPTSAITRRQPQSLFGNRRGL